MLIPNWSPFDHDQLLNALAGALGGAVKGMAQQLPWKQQVVAIMVGAACSIYMAPLGDSMLSPLLGHVLANDKQVVGLGGFIVGIIGIGLVGFVLSLFKMWQASKEGPKA